MQQFADTYTFNVTRLAFLFIFTIDIGIFSLRTKVNMDKKLTSMRKSIRINSNGKQ
jgi:hypothetical protein